MLYVCVCVCVYVIHLLPGLMCRVLFVQFVSVGWNAYLAWVAFR